jgi:hypothetical protein
MASTVARRPPAVTKGRATAAAAFKVDTFGLHKIFDSVILDDH